MKKYCHRLSRLGLGLCAATTFSAVSASAQTQSEPSRAPGTAPVDPASRNAGDIATLERVLALARERAPEVMVARAEVEASRSVGVGARVSPVLNPYLEVIAERGGRGVTRDLAFTAQL